ncbi:hypothetical protein FXO37_08765 [Capsicum annuum]|nr:hypothetical protein FXO37_08765 [Capsicum annuum]
MHLQYEFNDIRNCSEDLYGKTSSSIGARVREEVDANELRKIALRLATTANKSGVMKNKTAIFDLISRAQLDDMMAVIIQGIGTVTALNSTNSLDTNKTLFANSRRSLSDRKGRFFMVRSDGCLSYGLNGHGGRAEKLITNAVAAKEDTAAAYTSSKPGEDCMSIGSLSADVRKKMWTISYCDVMLLPIVVNGAELVQNDTDDFRQIKNSLCKWTFRRRIGRQAWCTFIPSVCSLEGEKSKNV